jgi:hypothetical protein
MKPEKPALRNIPGDGDINFVLVFEFIPTKQTKLCEIYTVIDEAYEHNWLRIVTDKR